MTRLFSTLSALRTSTILSAPADGAGGMSGGMGSSSVSGSSLDDIANSMIVQAADRPGQAKNETKNETKKSPPAGAETSPQAKRPAAPSVVSNEGVGSRGAGISSGIPDDFIDDQDDYDDADADGYSADGDDDAAPKAGDYANAEEGETEDDGDPLDNLFGDDADHDRGDSPEDDTFDASKLGDGVKLSVTVDGEEQEVTLGDLKRRYAGEGAIEKRLQQVTETRKKVFEDYEKQTALATQVMQNFGQLLFRRTISPPNEALLNSNPALYIQRKEAYEREGQALAAAQQQLHGMMQQLDGHIEEQRKAVRVAAAQELRRIMPAIADPVRGPKLTAALREAAREIGYSDADIAACTDPLMFKTMALAARELRRAKGTTVQKQKENPRTLKSAASKSVPSAQRRQQDALSRAAKTGSIDDIAASMIVPNRGKRGGRRT